MQDSEVTRQFTSGLTAKDLRNLGGILWLGQGAAMEVAGTPDFDGGQLKAFQNMIGECRICFLYSELVPQRKPPDVTATLCQIVAVRILDVTGTASGSCDVTVQPTVMTTRTAMLSSESAPSTEQSEDTLEGALANRVVDSFSNSPANSSGTGAPATAVNAGANRYVYKIRLTH
jgi:hypothetical protein